MIQKQAGPVLPRTANAPPTSARSVFHGEAETCAVLVSVTNESRALFVVAGIEVGDKGIDYALASLEGLSGEDLRSEAQDKEHDLWLECTTVNVLI